jgi:hypothetical protein
MKQNFEFEKRETVTVRVRRLAAGNESVAQLQNLWHANHRLGMVFLVGELHKKAENVRHKLLGAVAMLNQLELAQHKANEDALRVQQAVVDAQLQQLHQQPQHCALN